MTISAATSISAGCQYYEFKVLSLYDAKHSDGTLRIGLVPEGTEMAEDFVLGDHKNSIAW